jgi:AAA+ ATPase superfamily predicted ATPase
MNRGTDRLRSTANALWAAVTGAIRAVSRALSRLCTHRIDRWYDRPGEGFPGFDENLFVGREQLVDRILSSIHNNSILLVGERGVGKTSVLLQLMMRLPKIEDRIYEFLPVYVDLEGVPEHRLFSTLGDAILRQVGPLLDEDQSSAAGGVTSEYGHRDLAFDLRRVFRTLRGRSARQVRLVLLVDGIDQLNSYDPRTTQRLRGLYMMSLAENLVMVASGIEINKRWEREGSPWYNFFEEIELTALGREDAEEMIRRPVTGVFKYEEGAVDRIVALSEGMPSRIQALCRALVDRMYERNRRTITAADVDAVDVPDDV